MRHALFRPACLLAHAIHTFNRVLGACVTSDSREATELSYKALGSDQDGGSEDSAPHGGPHGTARIQDIAEDEQARPDFQNARASSNGSGGGDIDEIATTSLVISTGPNGRLLVLGCVPGTGRVTFL